jgi:hypothetical protein
MFGMLNEHEHSVRKEDGRVTFYNKGALHRDWEMGKKCLLDLKRKGYVETYQLPSMVRPEERQISRGCLSSKNLAMLDNIEGSLS